MFRSKHEQNLPSLEAERLYGAAAASRAGFCGVACAAGLGGGTGRGSDLAGTHQEWIAKMAGNSDQEDQRKKKEKHGQFQSWTILGQEQNFSPYQ